jgi:hypothetical protein
VRRVTDEADVRNPDPSPDGTRAVAVRNRFGKSQLVMVSLADGVVTELTPPSVEITYNSPAFSPDGARIAYVRFENGQWRLVVRDVAAGTEQTVATPAGSIVAQPVWTRDSIIATLGSGGFIELHEFGLDGSSRQLTRSKGAALGADVTDDGTIYFLSMDAEGFDIRRLTLEERSAALPGIDLPATLAPAIRPAERAAVPPLETRALPASRPYGLGRQELMWLLGGNSSPSNENFEAGLRIGDVVGRLNTLVVGSLAGDRGEQGGAIVSSWRGSPVATRVHLFTASQDFAKQRDAADLSLMELTDDVERRGGELALQWDAIWRSGRLDLEGGAYFEKVEIAERGDADHTGAFVRVAQSFRRERGRLAFREWASLRYTNGEFGDDSFDRINGTVGAGFGYGRSGVRGFWSRNSVSGAVDPLGSIVLGGAPTSIVPESVWSNRIISPALPTGVLVGEDHESQRVEVLGFLPFTVFAERHRVWSDDLPRVDREWLRIIGGEISFGFGPQPVIRFPGMEVRIGAGRVFDAPMKDENVWWITSRWTP